MKLKTNLLSSFCGALAFSVAPLQAQDAKPADQPPAAAPPPAAAQPLPAAPPPAASPQAQTPPAPAQRDYSRRPPMEGQQPQQGPSGPPRDDWHSRSNPSNDGGRHPGHGSGGGFRRPPMDDQHGGNHQRGEAPQQGTQGPRDPSQDGQRPHHHWGRPDGSRQPQGPQSYEHGHDRGNYQPDPYGHWHHYGHHHGHHHFSPRGEFGAPQGGEGFRSQSERPYGRWWHHGEQGQNEHGYAHRFGGRQDSPQFGRQHHGWRNWGSQGPDSRYEHHHGYGYHHFGSGGYGRHEGSGPQNYGRHEGNGPQHSWRPRFDWHQHGTQGGDRGHGFFHRDESRFAPPYQRAERGYYGPPPMNHDHDDYHDHGHGRPSRDRSV